MPPLRGGFLWSNLLHPPFFNFLAFLLFLSKKRKRDAGWTSLLKVVLLLSYFLGIRMEAVSITFLYRFFEFWLPLIGGALSFVLVRNSLVLRIIPSLLTFFLGVINIVSAVTPAIPERFALIRDFLPMFGTFIPKKLDTNVGIIKIMVMMVSCFITMFKLLEITDAKASIIPAKMSL